MSVTYERLMRWHLAHPAAFRSLTPVQVSEVVSLLPLRDQGRVVRDVFAGRGVLIGVPVRVRPLRAQA